VRGDHQPTTQHASLSCAGTSQPAARLHTSESSQEMPSRKSEGAPPLRDRNKPQTTTKERSQRVASPYHKLPPMK
jgi:hypothetical protein